MGDATMANPTYTTPVVEDDMDESPEASQGISLTQNGENSDPSSPVPAGSTEGNSKLQGPMQKRRRVTRACDECRRKKIKCDGKQPCTHCTVYSYDCTYDQPSNRRRNPAPQYIEALEQRLQKAEAVLHSVLPGVDLDDPKFDARGIEQIIESAKTRPNVKKQPPGSRTDDEGQIEPMVDRVGSLDLDDQGNWDFHGHSSGYAFMRRFRAQFGEQFLSDWRLPAKARHLSHFLESPRSVQSSPYDLNLTAPIDLPPREAAIELCRNTLDDCCALMRPLHRPTFFRRLHSIYDTEPDQYTNDHLKFLPLLYVVMALGFLFARSENENSMLHLKGYTEAIEQGYQFFNAGKQMLDITDCRDIMTIQAIFFMILFLQSSAKLATCYAYIGIALRACCRLGLHRNLPTHERFNAIELEERKRIFWLVRKIDAYVGAMLGLPQMLSDEDIDQELPSEVHDDYIQEDSLQEMPVGVFPLIKASNAHTKLTVILRKVVRYIYPIKGSTSTAAGSNYTVSHGRIRELEQDLQAWMDALPMELRPAENAGMELARVQQLLRISYAHVQMMMYRPFLHYVSQASQTAKGDKRSFACAAACVSVARNIVHITSEMKRRGLLIGSYWFVMYTTFFAIVSLVYFVLENPNSPTCQDILRDALEGRDTLASLAQRSFAADRCTNMLKSLFNELPEKLNERRGSSQTITSGKKRSKQTADMESDHTQSNPHITFAKNEIGKPPNRARTLPQDYLTKIAKRSSFPDVTKIQPGNKMEDYSSPQNLHVAGLSSPMMASPLSQQFEYGPQMGQSQIPDLKNVMFPSDNPFAYPNQPISTLESVDGQFAYPDPNSSVDSPFQRSTEHSMMGTPTSMPSQPHVQPQPYEMNNIQRMFESNPELAQQMAQHSKNLGGPMAGFNPDMGVTQGQPYDMVGPTQEDYWTHVEKGSNMGTRVTGFTPGPGVNLDELFGGDGWGNMWGTQDFRQ